MIKLKPWTPTVLSHIYKILKLEYKSKKLDGSFAGEYKALKNLVNKMNTLNDFIVDIAASDGWTQSPTYPFFKEGWPGFAIELDPLKFSCLSFLYAKFPEVSLIRNKVTPSNVVSLMEGCNVPKDFAILNLDIDSYDLHVLHSLLKAGFRPNIISM
jgi:hypothetical protein